MRSKEPKPGRVLVYKYGAKAPIMNRNAVNDQIFQAYIFKRQLTNLYYEVRKSENAYIDSVVTDDIVGNRLLETEQKLRAQFKDAKDIRNRLKANRPYARQLYGNPDFIPDQQQSIEIAAWENAVRDSKEKLEIIIADLKEVRQHLYPYRRAVRKSHAEAVKKIHDDSIKGSESKKAFIYGASPVYGHTKNFVCAAVKQSYEKSFPDPPRVPDYKDEEAAEGIEGIIGITTTKSEYVKPENYFQILTSRNWNPGYPFNPNRWRVLRLRIGSDGAKPIWAEVPFVMHRPFPDGSQVLEAKLSRRRSGYSVRWEVLFTIRVSAQETTHPSPWSAHVTLGCQEAIGGIQVASGDSCLVLDDITIDLAQSKSRERDKSQPYLELPPGVRNTPATIARVRDMKFNKTRVAICEFAKTSSAPEWMKNEAARIVLWRSEDRLAQFIRRWKYGWKDNDGVTWGRFPGDEDIFSQAEDWRLKEAHLCDMECNIRMRARNRRLHIYRVFAADLCRKYSTIHLVKPKLAPVKGGKKRAKENKPDAKTIRQQVRHKTCAIYSLYQCIKNAASATGTILHVTEVKPSELNSLHSQAERPLAFI